MKAAESLSPAVGTVAACLALDVSRASFYRRYEPRPQPKPQPTPSRALTASERKTVLDTLHSERFVDLAPYEVYATLLDDDTYLCSIRTMYRILAANDEVRERRRIRRHPHYHKPELLAEGPNEVWSWDITKLRGPAKWVFYQLYVILDIFSRNVVGWLVADRESETLAEHLLAETCRKQQIAPGQLTVHADRGSSMKSKCVAELLSDLGVTKSHSRPHVSDDNPFSESQFKTLKYRPEFPQRFGSLEDARAFCRSFFRWYNERHCHSGIGLLTPHAVHYGQALHITEQRRQVLARAYREHPNRFVRKPPEPPKPPTAVWINPPKGEQTEKISKPEQKPGATIATGALGTTQPRVEVPPKTRPQRTGDAHSHTREIDTKLQLSVSQTP